MFSIEDRKQMLKDITSDIKNVEISSFENQYLINYAKSRGVGYIVRGIRNPNDYEYEKTMRNINGDIDGSITTCFLMPPREISEISSSMVKGLIGPDGWEELVSRYVPIPVLYKFLGRKHQIHQHLVDVGAKIEERDFWNGLSIQFDSEKRAYHNWKHLVALSKEFDLCRKYLSDPLSVELAIWYHDLFQDIQGTMTNEVISAEAAVDLVEFIGLSDEFGERVRNLIIATEHKNPPQTQDEAYFIDMDLSILGKDKITFGKYEADIRKEYRHIPDNIFKPRRKEILKSFLGRQRVYHTEYFRDLYEDQARINLKESIADMDH